MAPAVTPTPDLARVGRSGAVWQGVAQALGKGIVLVTAIILARVLTPQEYGTVSLALVVIGYVEVMADGGVAQALVVMKRGRESARAALLLSLISAAALALAVVLLAPVLQNLLGWQGIAPLVQTLAVALLVTAFGAVPEALLRKELRFRRLTWVSVARSTANGIVTVALALSGVGAWSLVWGTLAGAVAFTVSAWVALRPERVPWQVWRSRRAPLRQTMRLGLPLAGSQLLSRLHVDVDFLIIAGVLGAQALGYYTLAFRLPELLIINFFFVLSAVIYPLYAKAREQEGRLEKGYLTSVRIQSLYGVTAGAGLAVTAPALVPLVFGPQWDDAVMPLVLLAAYAAARSLGAGSHEVYKATGRVWVSVLMSGSRLVVIIPSVLWATYGGIVGVAAAMLAVALVYSVLHQVTAARILGLRATAVGREVLPALACGLAIVLVGLVVRLAGLPDLIELLLTVVAGIGASAAVLRFLFPTELRELVSLIRR